LWSLSHFLKSIKSCLNIIHCATLRSIKIWFISINSIIFRNLEVRLSIVILRWHLIIDGWYPHSDVWRWEHDVILRWHVHRWILLRGWLELLIWETRWLKSTSHIARWWLEKWRRLLVIVWLVNNRRRVIHWEFI